MRTILIIVLFNASNISISIPGHKNIHDILAIFTAKPDNISTFLGRRFTYNCKRKQEIGTDYNQRILGTRIKYHMGDASIKMYDNFGCILQIESTCNDVGNFQVMREVERRDRTTTEQKVPLKKSIYTHETRQPQLSGIRIII